MASEYRKKLMKKYKKLGVEFDENGKPLNMKQIYEDDRELFLDLQDDYFTTRGTMDEGKPDLEKWMKKIKEMMKSEKNTDKDK